MMKIFFFFFFLIPFMLKNKFWNFQNFLFGGMLLFMFLGNYSYDWSYLSYCLGMDLLSFALILLTIWICSLMVMSSYLINMMNNFSSLFIFMIWILMMFLFLTFSVTNLFLFYLFFECSLVPTLFLILGWGLQLDRIQAGLYLLFYTLFASFPFLLSILYLFNYYNTLLFLMFFEGVILLNNLFMYLCLIFAFLVKMPMFFVHLWLPKAHVEAPVSGSMILAGIMLKLGGYGLLRLMSILFYLGIKFNYIWISISIMGGLFVSLICLFQVDLKSLIAYSSVAHMSLLLGGLMTLMNWGICGSFILMISHGLCSSGLFCLVNIVYERMGSRSIMINKGLINFMPSLSLWWFLLCSSNMAAPPSLNLLGEIMLINSIISWSNFTLIMLIFLSFFSASYTLYLYSYTQHGLLNFNLYSFTQGYLREFILLILHWIPLNMLIIWSDLFVVWI